VREEECLVSADDGVLALLEKNAGEDADVPNAVQTYRDASASFCGLLADKSAADKGSADKSADVDSAATRAVCVANRESELARLIDEHGTGGRAPSAVVTGVAACDGAFKTRDEAAWSTLTECAIAHVKAKSAGFVSSAADGDPLATLSGSREHVAMLLGTSINAGNGVCDVLAPKGGITVARCRASVATNIVKAVADVLH